MFSQLAIFVEAAQKERVTLKILRALENLFYGLASYFEDWADSIDTEFHDELRKALNEAITGFIEE